MENNEDAIKINTSEIKNKLKTTFDFFKQKKVAIITVGILFLFILILGSWIRVQNLSLLKDQTTGEYIPTALDPFYFLRIAKTIVEQGSLPQFDAFRKPFDVPYTHEILGKVIVFLYKIMHGFDSKVTIQFVDVIYPVIFFALGIILFFFFIYMLTKSKTNALISSVFLAIIPPYLYRTMAGFSDHEAIGMFSFFLSLLIYTAFLKYLKEKDKSLIKTGIFGIVIGFVSTLTLVSWGGIANFIFMVIPVSYALLWLLEFRNTEEINKPLLYNFFLFYVVWFFSSIIFGPIYGLSIGSMIDRVVLTSSSIVNGAVFLFLFVDFLVIKLYRKISFIKKENLIKLRPLYSFLGAIVIGVVFLILSGRGVFSFIFDIANRLIHPFGAERVGLTVAENAQPFLNDWINQIGKIFFWIFVAGMVFIGFDLASGIERKKSRFLFSFVWIILILGILFSRISATSLFNGTNFISRVLYFGSLLLFFVYSVWIYFKEKINIKPELILISSWLIFTLIAARGAVRLFFAITPFATFMGGYAITRSFSYLKKNKDEIVKMFIVIFIVLILVSSVLSFNRLYGITSAQAKNTGPSAGIQWQSAMKWTRENTPIGSVFVHWWDYGYWIQYLGQRPTVADGGHFQGVFRDHMIGRYLLTTPNPETALSFMKTNNISYLLIDPTDLGKYGAYSRIGSDVRGEDRFSQIPIMALDSSKTTETNNSEIRIYQGGIFVDDDIIYQEGDNKIFLPANKAAIVATMINFSKNSQGQVNFNRVYGIFIYNNQQINIPLRYLYFNGQLIDFGEGLDAVVRIVPYIATTGGNVQIDNLGMVIYLSPKVSKSLFAQLYLMNDAFHNYPTIQLAHSEPDSFVNGLNAQGAGIKDFIYFQGFRGPIKIWKVDYPSNIVEKEEFLRTEGTYAEFDNLTFVK